MLKCCLPWGWPGSRRGVSTGYGYGLRLPDSLVGENEATFLNIGKNHHGPVDGGYAVQWVAIHIPMPLQARGLVLRGSGGRGAPGVRVTMAIC